jgi:threonine dehydratase
MVTFEDVKSALERVSGVVVKTPVMTSTTIDRMTNAKVYFKCENFQRVGAFKFRGAYNSISQLTDEERKNGVITHSSGNHAQAVALASSILGIHATIVMPTSAPRVKKEATRGYGAEIVFCEPTLESRTKTTNELIEKHGFTLIHPFDNSRVIAGAGTAAYELIQEVGDLDYVFGPVGGGGLISGTSIAVKGLCPKAKVIAVEPENADDAYRSFKSGKLYPSVNPNTIADGLLTSLSERTFAIVCENVDDIITVSESEIISSMRLLWERMKMVVEPSGGVSLAGVLKLADEVKEKRIGVIISGGNIELDEFFKRYET